MQRVGVGVPPHVRPAVGAGELEIVGAIGEQILGRFVDEIVGRILDQIGVLIIRLPRPVRHQTHPRTNSRNLKPIL